MSPTTVTVGSTPVALIPAAVSTGGVLSVGLTNSGSEDVRIGDSNVTATSGFLLKAGDSLVVDLGTASAAQPTFPVVHDPDGDVHYGPSGGSQPGVYTVSGRLYAVAASSGGSVDVITAQGPGGVSLPGLGQTAVDARVRAVGDGIYQSAPMKVDELTFPADGAIAHRGGANLYPENTMVAYESSAALGVKMIEAGDVRALTDGAFACLHNDAVDHSTTATGNISDMTSIGVRTLVVDASTWQSSNWPNQSVPLWSDVLNRIGGRCIIVPEVKDGQDSTAQAMVDELDKRGLKDSAVIQSFYYSNVQLIESLGVKTMLLAQTIGDLPDAATMQADGIWSVGVNHAEGAALAGLATTLHAAEIKVFAFTVDHQVDWQAIIDWGLDGAFTNDPLYAPGKTAAYRQSGTTWHLNGVHGHGCARSGDGPFTSANRGDVFGTPGKARWTCILGAAMSPGEILPVANPTGTYTITLHYSMDKLPSSSTTGMSLYVCAPDDSCVLSGADIAKSYIGKMRQSGALDVYQIDATGTATKIGASLLTTKMQLLTLSAGLAANVAVTSLAVSATTQAVKAGHQFYLPSGDYVTIAADAAIGATSLTINSYTPPAAVANGATLSPRIGVKAAITPTTVTFSRTDEAATGSIVVNDATWRGAYVATKLDGDGGASLEQITVS